MTTSQVARNSKTQEGRGRKQLARLSLLLRSRRGRVRERPRCQSMKNDRVDTEYIVVDSRWAQWSGLDRVARADRTLPPFSFAAHSLNSNCQTARLHIFIRERINTMKSQRQCSALCIDRDTDVCTSHVGQTSDVRLVLEWALKYRRSARVGVLLRPEDTRNTSISIQKCMMHMRRPDELARQHSVGL